MKQRVFLMFAGLALWLSAILVWTDTANGCFRRHRSYCVAVAAAQPDVKAAKPAGTKGAQDFELVNNVEKIELEGTGTPPVHYLIKVTGSVLRPNYRSPMLIIKSQTPDAKGNLTYYFAAEAPIGGSPGTPVRIQANRYLFDLHKVKRITIIAETNEIYKDLP